MQHIYIYIYQRKLNREASEEAKGREWGERIRN